ncbi:Uncharacterised protein [Serratia proteamaculans]|nr:Uncharacterised protein [Serratia proteamaculans]CAI0756303.1 Uncharacterised protein [Serratia proteamaculans]CAI0759508.1 Uncharacterised protein [Serratia proteamaculans]CAI0761505.1 Uncharacterised protein [Serratia proteamaculans]CAI0815192.1 Uncharacterised protein [Serratia proteamaculans]
MLRGQLGYLGVGCERVPASLAAMLMLVEKEAR